MTEHLVFRLYAPMASWGEAAVGETRPTATYPGRGAIIGLIGAALGVRRDDDEGQRRLRGSLSVAVKQYSGGVLMRDYHTVQVPPSQSKVHYRSRREELSVSKDALNTILSTRDYRCDGLWVVAIRLTTGAEWTLNDLKSALEKPRFPLFLGRKACPLAAPLAPALVRAEHWRQALDHHFEGMEDAEKSYLALIGNDTQDRRLLRFPDQVVYAWEGDVSALDGDVHGAESSEVWDEPLHRRRWQFGARVEHRRMVRIEEGS